MSVVMVTGASGYIGSVVTSILRESGHVVIEKDLGLYAESRFPEGRTEVEPWDSRSARPSDFSGIDAVVHLAALSNDPVGDLSPRVTYEINHDGTMRTAEAAKQAGVERFIFASSCSLYGAAGGGGLMDETAPFVPLTPYAETKVTAEDALSKMADDDFSPTYLRNATVYGPSAHQRLDIVVNDLCATAVATNGIRLLSDGTSWRPQVHVTDVARAVVAAIEAPRDVVHNEAFNVGRSEENLQVRDIVAMVVEAMPTPVAVEFAEGAGTDPRSYQVDFSKIDSLLPAWKPQWTVADGVAELLDVFLRAGITESDFPRYRRLAEVKRLMAAGRLSMDLHWL